MELIEFPEQTVVYAKDQPQYRPLPAHLFKDAEGTIVCCWRLSWRERLSVLFRGVIWHQVLTFHQPLQPQLLMVEKPAMGDVALRWMFGGRMFWAGDRYLHPGIYWARGRHRRILPVPRWLAMVLPS